MLRGSVPGEGKKMSVYLWPDVSNTNGRVIDAALAKHQGMSAIAAKATEGTSFVDKFLKPNYDAAVAAGLPFMAYHFADAGSGDAQAAHFLDVVDRTVGLKNCTLLLDRERDLNGAIMSGHEIDQFITRVQKNTASQLVIYEAGWVVAGAGASPLAATLPLIWPNYVDKKGEPDGGDANQLLKRVTPNQFQPFGGHTKYAARQFSSKAGIGGISPCDVNVCFDDALFMQLFKNQGDVDMTPDQAKQLQQLHDMFLAPVHDVGAGVPWALDQALGVVRSLQTDITAIKAHLGMN